MPCTSQALAYLALDESKFYKQTDTVLYNSLVWLSFDFTRKNPCIKATTKKIMFWAWIS